MKDLLDNIITRHPSKTGPVRRDLIQIIMDAHNENPAEYPEDRVQDEIGLFM